MVRPSPAPDVASIASITRTRAVLVLAAAVLLALVGLAGPSAPARAAAGSVPVPPDGTAYFGVHLGDENPSTYVQRAGVRPAVYGHFVALPLTPAAKQSLTATADAAGAYGGRLFLTAEPLTGLAAVTPEVAQDLAATLQDLNARGVDVFLRFAHEMNGSWYAWGQQPTAYRTAFRRVADAVHATAPRTVMVWAPNYGGGYPFTGGTYAAAPGTADFAELDTDHDGHLSMADDPYAPYYPGDASVDWVGQTLYHFGNAWPYGENETPEPDKLAQQLHGDYTGNGRFEDQSALPDFYRQYAVDRAKPMALTETGALYAESPPQPGDSEQAVKAEWLRQVYAVSTRDAFPLLKMVNWFEIRKYESEVGGVVDWRATADPAVRALLRSYLDSGRYVLAPTPAPPTPPAPPPPPAPAVPPGAPTKVTGRAATAPARVVLHWRAPASDGGSPVVSYTACRGRRTACRTVVGTRVTTTFRHLRRRTAYRFSVRATSVAGNGPWARVTVVTR